MRDILNFIVSQAANSLTFTTQNIQSVALTLTRTLKGFWKGVQVSLR